jgi:RNA polymerase sigma-54 factor
MLKKLIAEESPATPLSDNQLTNLLNQQGINVARRTVAKYREAMSIAPSHERKALLPS